MESSIDHKMKDLMDKAAKMDAVPLVDLHRLITFRLRCAMVGSIDGVKMTNDLIRKLLACDDINPKN